LTSPKGCTGSSPLTFNSILERGPVLGGIATLIFRYFLRYFSSTRRTDLSRFRGTFHSFDPVGFAIFAIPQFERLERDFSNPTAVEESPCAPNNFLFG
jgi:hypothetical protein